MIVATLSEQQQYEINSFELFLFILNEIKIKSEIT